MKADLYIAASLEGYIADENGGTDWVCDETLFEQTVREYGCICMGHATYREYGGPAFDGVQHIVLTHKPPKKDKDAFVHFVASVNEALTKTRELGFKKLLVIGGAKTNQSFMQQDRVGKVFVDIHPILLRQGLPMFGDYKTEFDFKMLMNKWHNEGFMHAEYTIGKPRKAVVVIIIRDQDGRYFAHRRHKDKKHFPSLWGLGAGGRVEPDETPQEGAVRELYEETSLKTAIRRCFDFAYKDATQDHTVYVFETQVKKPKKFKNDQEWEVVDWVNAEQINNLMNDDKLCADTKELYQKYRANLKD